MKVSKTNRQKRARWEMQQCQNLVTEVNSGKRYPLVATGYFTITDSRSLLRTFRGINAPRPYITSANRDIRVPASQMHVSFVGLIDRPTLSAMQEVVDTAYRWGLKAIEVYQPVTCLNISGVVERNVAKAPHAARKHFKASAPRALNTKDVRDFLNDVCLSKEPLLVNGEFSSTTFEIFSVMHVTNKGKLVKLPSRSGKSKTPYLAFFSETPRFIVKHNGNPNAYSRNPLSYRLNS